MKTKTKKGIFHLGVAFLLCFNTIFACILIENTELETDIQEKNLLKLTSQSNSINTPEIEEDDFSNYYIENFTTTTYMDDIVTNSSGWGLGNITLPEKNITLSRTATSGYSLCILGDTAYIGGGGVYIYNITDRSSPVLLGYNSSSLLDSREIYVVGDYLFGAAGPWGVRVIDVSDPTSISFVTSINNYWLDTFLPIQDEHEAWRIWALPGPGTATYVYILDDWHGFVSFLFTEPNTIVQTGGYDPASPGGVIYPKRGNLQIVGNIAFCSYNDILMIDITNRVNPTYIYTYTPGTAREMYVSGNLIYFADEATNPCYFRILNVADPYNPVLVYSTPHNSEFITHISVTNNIACIGYGVEIDTDIYEGHFDAYNVSIPSNPVLIHSYISPETRYVTIPSRWGGVFEIETADNYGYMIDTDFFIVDLNLLGLYEPPSIAQSTLIYSGSNNNIITHVRLNVSETIIQNTEISYYISVDDGTHWEEVITNTIHQIQYIGSNLKWYALLNTSNPKYTPVLKNLTIEYLHLLKAPSLTIPLDSSHTIDDTPYFEWEDIPEAIEYIIQLDTSTTFDSVDYRNNTVSNNYWTANPFLPDDTWYWRVAGIDSKSDVGFFSAYNELSVDVLPGQPSLILPENNKHIVTHAPTFTWTDAYDAVNYTLQIDSSNTFSSGDLITHSQLLFLNYSLTSPLTEGAWYWRVQAFDATGNNGTYSNVNLVTIDSTIPSINQPNDTSYEEGSTGNEIVWNPDDINPYRYEVARGGTVVTNLFWNGSTITEDIDGLSAGTYIYICTVYDKAGNSISDSVTVTVETGTTNESSISGYTTLGIIASAAIPVIFLMLKKFKKRSE